MLRRLLAQRQALLTPRSVPQRACGRFYTTTATPKPATDKKPFIRMSHPTAKVAAYNHQLSVALRKRQKNVLKDVQAIVDEIKANHIKFDAVTYNALLIAYTRSGRSEDAIKTLKEMIQEGFEPTIDSYNIILESTSKNNSTDQQAVVDLMKEQGVALTPLSYQYLVRRAAHEKSPVAKISELFDAMKASDMEPTLLTFNHAIHAAYEANDADHAVQWLKEAEALHLPVETEPRILMDVLRATAMNDKGAEMEAIWRKVVDQQSLRPDEGTCMHVLRVAGQMGDTKLASDVIRQLGTSGYPYKEHYFIPLMEAFVAKDDLKSAFHVLDIMRMSGVLPTKRSTFAISVQLSKNVDHIDQAYYLLEEIKKENKTVDVAAFNMVVQACSLAKDIGRTVATYREAEQLGVQPNIDTFNAVLDACLLSKMNGMGQIVITELKKAKVAPNADTFTKMIALSCDKRNYEDAFVYLEEMKSNGINPPRQSYIVLAKRLARARDPRYHLVLEEMHTYGYKPSNYVKSLW
ncbi:hypothetical protein BC940DRAFT_308740 [Gongronella butleri]|nr:hypothetical protein BC940DRAFT_308740 [Gongronella butleri]